jgi:hypothetical protein
VLLHHHRFAARLQRSTLLDIRVRIRYGHLVGVSLVMVDRQGVRRKVDSCQAEAVVDDALDYLRAPMMEGCPGQGQWGSRRDFSPCWREKDGING